MVGEAATRALEKALANKREHSKVRGQAAESLAHNHRPDSHRILRENLKHPSKEVRFWCAYALAEMADEDALIALWELATSDYRVVRGFWSVSLESNAAIRIIREEMKKRGDAIRHVSSALRYWRSRILEHRAPEEFDHRTFC
jgi:HEAT repeat protein